MSSRPHYFAIGVFVLVATTLGILGVVALSSDALRSPKYFIETYLDESVQGVDIGTPFKFRGVKIGNISEIKMVSSVYDTTKVYVMIRVALNEEELFQEAETLTSRVGMQVDQGLRLKLVPQGITGLSFLEADFYPDAADDRLNIDWEPKYAYIPSTPAMMTLVSRSIEHITAQINTLNLEAIGENVELITSNLNRSVQQIEQITRQVAGVSGGVVDDVRQAAADLPSVTSNLNATVILLEEIMGDSDRDIEQILSNMRYITDDTRELIRMLKRHPGMLLSEPPEKNLSRGGKRK